METASNKKKLSDEIFDQLKQKIIAGEWKPGHKLPTEKELMEMFHASRVTVREPIKQLVGLGMLETRQGAGTFVRPFNAESFMASLSPMICNYALSKQEMLDIFEFRKIEVMIVGLAAERSDDEGVRELRRIQDEMYKNRHNPDTHLRTDHSFHLQIGKMTRNPYLIQISTLLSESLHKVLIPIAEIMGVEHAIYYHMRLIDTIEKHYVHEAMATMEEHLQTAVDRINQLPEDAEFFR